MSTKDFSSLQEKRIANYLGWKVVSGSGSRPCAPGDVKSDNWLGECKTHVTVWNTWTFLDSVWKKLSDEAMSQFKFPALFVDDGSQQIEMTWCLVPMRAINWVEVNATDTSLMYIECSRTFRKNIVFQRSDLFCPKKIDTPMRILHNNTALAFMPLTSFHKICEIVGLF